MEYRNLGRTDLNVSLIGLGTMTQLKSNIASIDIKLPIEVRDKIENIRRDHPMPF